MDEDSFHTPDHGGIEGDSFLAREDIALSLSALSRQERETVELNENYTIAGRFLVKRMLGMGGMGVVYLVHDTLLDVDRALKVMLPSLVSTPEAQNRFFREIRVLQSLTHPGIVRIFDSGLDEKEERAYFTMEYIEGKALSEVLGYHTKSERVILTAPVAISYMTELLGSLGHAHQKVVHRDLKPQNIMVRPDGSLVVLDFGLAKIVTDEQRMRSLSAPGGTPFYMSPEQWRRGASIGIRSDLYSVGIMLYEMLTGMRPTGLFVSPSELNASVPKRLDQVIRKCLEPDPKDRYASAEELIGELELSLVKRPLKWPKWVGVGVMVATVLLGLAYYFLSDPVGEARREVLSARDRAQEVGAETYASDLWGDGEKALEKARNAALYETVANALVKYEEAEDLFHSAARASEARIADEEGMRIIASRAGAIEAALTDEHRAKAPDWVKSGLEALALAENTEELLEQRVLNYQKAIDAFDRADTETMAAIEIETKAAAEKALADLRQKVQLARDQVDETVRKNAPKDVAAGDAAWATAISGVETYEIRVAAFQEAKTAYETGMSASKRMAAAQMDTQQQMEAMETAREQAVESRDEAVTGDAETYSIDLLNSGDTFVARAASAGSEKNFVEAESLYADARKEFVAALEKANEDTTASRQMNTARKSASDARARVPADPEGVGRVAMASGTKSWNQGEEEGASATERAGNYRKAADDFGRAKSQIEEAQRVADEMAAKKALEEKIVLAKSDAGRARELITDEVRKYSKALTDEGDAAWTRGEGATTDDVRLNAFMAAKGAYTAAMTEAKVKVDQARLASNEAKGAAEAAHNTALRAEAEEYASVELAAGDGKMVAGQLAFDAGEFGRARDAYAMAATYYVDAQNNAKLAVAEIAEADKAVGEGRKEGEGLGYWREISRKTGPPRRIWIPLEGVDVEAGANGSGAVTQMDAALTDSADSEEGRGRGYWRIIKQKTGPSRKVWVSLEDGDSESDRGQPFVAPDSPSGTTVRNPKGNPNR